MIVAGGEGIINPYEIGSDGMAMSGRSARQLFVAHYHLRPGGVRRVIETALPAVVARGEVEAVTLVTGEPPAPEWLQRVRESLGKVPLVVEVHREFLYFSELSPPPEDLASRLEKICAGLLARGGESAVLWVHNLALGRSVPVATGWARAASTSGAVFLSHHHDFFFDNRWIRWPEMCASGIADLDEAAAAVFPAGGRTAHLAINRSDHALLAGGFAERAVWMPNPVIPPQHHHGAEREARHWLRTRTGEEAPYWLLPSRLLRRKNIAEAVLLARWLRPGARVVTTGGPTSVDEEPYDQWLRSAALRHAWPLDLSVMAGRSDAPAVSALMAGAEAVLLTSLQEGFGLPYLEAAAARSPLMARALPNVLPDLLALGLQAPSTYADVMVPVDLFDHAAECVRQRTLWKNWRAALPQEAQDLAGEPLRPDRPEGLMAFNRLTATAQEAVLARPAGDTVAALSEANPSLAPWRGVGRDLPAALLTDEAAAALSPERFAEGFWSAVDRAASGAAPESNAPQRVMRAFLAERLRGDNLYPLLFSSRS